MRDEAYLDKVEHVADPRRPSKPGAVSFSRNGTTEKEDWDPVHHSGETNGLAQWLKAKFLSEADQNPGPRAALTS